MQGKAYGGRVRYWWPLAMYTTGKGASNDAQTYIQPMPTLPTRTRTKRMPSRMQRRISRPWASVAHPFSTAPSGGTNAAVNTGGRQCKHTQTDFDPCCRPPVSPYAPCPMPHAPPPAPAPHAGPPQCSANHGMSTPCCGQSGNPVPPSRPCPVCPFPEAQFTCFCHTYRL